MTRRARVFAGLVVGLMLTTPAPQAQTKITTPKEHFGFNVGDDYQLANYTQFSDYVRKLDKESDRMTLVEIGKTAEGRPQLMGIITAPANFKKLERYKEISRRLALAEGLTDDQARALAAEGKAVVWIDGGLHATEVLGAAQLTETIYQLVSRTDSETMRFLNDVIVLAAHANPDGMELVSNWYMRESEPTRRSTSDIPRLYQKYVGHDNNRDFYMANQPESENINRVLYREWFPQIVYNHHQTGPPGTVMFAPPFRDPFNYVYDPLIPLGIDLVGAAMHNRFAAEGKPGVTMRKGSSYSTWWNGGLRTTVYFHNQIGLLTETIGNPTPIDIPFLPDKQLAGGDLPYPIAPQRWHFRQSVDYSITANRAVLDVASKYREDFLFNIYLMGRNSIRRGNEDTWTMYPKRIAATQTAIAKEQPAAQENVGGGRQVRGAPVKFYEGMRDPSLRDARGYVISSAQPDFLTATKFVNTLIKTGVTVHRATSAFQVAGQSYPAGSYVVKSAQAFRPHVLDMFEPQDHPNDIPYPGGPPTPPYDSAGWTVAYQMGLQFERILEGFDGPFEKVTDVLAPSPGQVTQSSGAAGYLLSHQVNDAFVAVNRLLKANEEVYWMKTPVAVGNAGEQAPGAMFIPAKATTLPILQKLATDKGLTFHAVSSQPTGEALKLKPVRIGLWDRYGGSMPSGWLRWIFEQYEFPYEVVFPQTLDAGNLNAKFDVLIFMEGAIPEREGGGQAGFFAAQPAADRIPAEFRGWLGNVTADKTIPQLKKFLEDGGTILTIGDAGNLAYQLRLPITNFLVERTANAVERPLPREKFYVPGSVMRVSVDNTNPLAYGMPSEVDVFFDHSPVYKLQPPAAIQDVQPVAWFASGHSLRSGWAWGQEYLEGGVAAIDAPVGKGRLFVLAPEVTFRAQPHGTFKFVFNGIYYGTASQTALGAVPTTAQEAR